MPQLYTPQDFEEYGLTGVELDITHSGSSQSKADVLSQRKQEKINTLSNRLGLAPTDRTNTYVTTEEGYRDSMANKIANEYSPEQLQYLIGRTYKEKGVFETPQGYMTYEGDELVPYQGDASQLGTYYGFGSKGDEDVVKTGTWGGLDPRERYSKDYLAKYGQEVGPEGVDVQQQDMRLLMPKEYVDLLENLQHGNVNALNYREARQKEGELEQYQADKERLGSGTTEYYKGGYTGAFGGAGDVTKLGDTEQLWQEFSTKYGLEGAEQPRIRSYEEYRREKLAEEREESPIWTEAKQVLAGTVAGVGKGAIELADAIQEVGTWVPQQAVRILTGDEDYDIDWISNELKEAGISAIDDIVGYDREYYDQVLQGMKDDLAKAGVDITSFDAMKQAFTDPEKRQYLSDATLSAMASPAMLASMVAEIVGAGGVLGAGTKVAGRVGAKIAPELTDKVSTITKSNYARIKEELAAARKAGDKARVKELEKSYTLTKRLPDLMKGTVYTNADMMIRVNNDIEEFTANNDGEAPDAAKVLQIIALDRLASSAEIGALKQAARVGKLTDEALEVGLKNAATRISKELGKSVSIEAAQETMDGIVEQINQKYGSADYAGMGLEELLSATSADILTGTIAGAATGGYISIGGEVKDQLVDAGTDAVGMVQEGLENRRASRTDTAKAAEERAKRASEVMQEFQSAAPLNQEVATSQETGDVDALQKKIAQHTAMIRMAEEQGFTDILEQGYKELEELKAQLPQTRVLGSDPVERKITISELFERLGEQGVDTAVVEGFAKVNQLDETERRLVNRSIKQGKRIAEIKKGLDSVSKEVSEGARGYLTYYNNVRDALVRGESDAVDANMNELARFTESQEEKLASMRSAERQVAQDIYSEITARAESMGITEAEAADQIRSKYVRGKGQTPVTQKFKYPSGTGTYTINKGAVFERNIEGNTRPISHYLMMDTIEREVGLMKEAYTNLVQDVLGEDFQPITPESEVDPTAFPEGTRFNISVGEGRKFPIERTAKGFNALANNGKVNKAYSTKEFVDRLNKGGFKVSDVKYPEPELVQEASIEELDQPVLEEAPVLMDDSVFDSIPEEVEVAQPDTVEPEQDVDWAGLETMAETMSEEISAEPVQPDFQAVEAESAEPGKGYYTDLVDSRVSKFRDTRQELVEIEKALVNDPENKELLDRKEELVQGIEMASLVPMLNSPAFTRTVNVPTPDMVKVEGWSAKDGLKGLFNVRATGLNVGELQLPERLAEELRSVVGTKSSNYNAQMTALRMLMGTNGKDIDPYVAVAMEGAVQGWLVENAGTLTAPKDLEEIAEMLNVNVTELSMEALIMLSEGGELLKFAADSIGQEIMKALGISGDGIADSLEASIRSGLGLMAVTLAENRGWIKDLKSTKLKVGTSEADTTIVQATPKLFEDMELLRGRTEDFQAAFGIELDNSRNYRTTKPDATREVGIRNQPYTKATDVQVQAIKRLESMDYELNSGVEVLLEMYPTREELLEALGWVDTSNRTWKNVTPLNVQRSTMGKNRSIEVAVDSLLQVVEEKPENIYFNWFATKAGRYNLDSTMLNPQTDKNLARWLVTVKQEDSTVDKSVVEGLTGKEDPYNRSDAEKKAVMFAYGVVQAFDGSSIEGLPAIDKNNEVEIVGAAKKILVMDKAELVEYAKEADHLGHAASAIANIVRYQEADGEFEADIQVELDGLTNGFSFKTMQHAVSDYDTMVKWWEKVGVVAKGSRDSMNERAEGFEDVYMAAGAVSSDDSKLQELLTTRDGDEDWVALQKARTSKLQKKLDKLGMTAQLEGKTLRNLMKGPVMTFVYSAGIPSIKNAIVKDKVQEFLEKVNTKENGKYVLSNDELADMFGISVTTNVRASLAKNLLESNNSVASKVSLELEQHFRAVYANPVGAALKSTFAEFIELNQNINNAFTLAYQVFKKKYQDADPLTMTRKEKQKLIKDYLELTPMVKGPDSKGLEDQILIMSRQLEQLDLGGLREGVVTDAYVKARTQRPTEGQFDETVTVQLILRGLGAPGAAGNVLPIQTMDGSAMGRTIIESKNGYLGVHDAQVLGVNGFDDITNYNKNWIGVNNSSSLIEDTLAMLERVEKAAKKEGIDVSTLAVGTTVMGEPIGISSVKFDLKRYADRAKANVNRLKQNDIMVGQMVGPRGTMVEMDKVSAEAKPEPKIPSIEVGSWVTYKDSTRLVTEIKGDKVRLVNPLLKGSNVNVLVNRKNVLPTNIEKAEKVTANGVEYLVTPKGTAINLNSGKKVDWEYVNSNAQQEVEAKGKVEKLKATPQQINKADRQC